MTEKKYRKWDEIINPALERSRMRETGDLREERTSAILDRLGGGTTPRTGDRQGSPSRPGKMGEEREAENEKNRGQGDVAHSPLLKGQRGDTGKEKNEGGEDAPHPVHGGVRSRPSQPGGPNRQTILTDTSVRDGNAELNPEEARVLREKRAKIQQVMNEFVTWKESLK